MRYCPRQVTRLTKYVVHAVVCSRTSHQAMRHAHAHARVHARVHVQVHVCVCPHQVTHRFSDSKIDKLALADVPALLFEYQIMARAWCEPIPRTASPRPRHHRW